MTKKAAIIGTAPSYRQAPWHDQSIKMIALNDSYVLGLPRIDEFYELHPLDKMYFRKKDQTRVLESAVPKGHYVRPEGHLEFLREAAKTIPVWLQQTPPDDWPEKAYRFPIEAVEAKYGTYWASGPAYELMHLYERGFREIHIYGIHLSTEHEYREQRPNFEALMRGCLGAEIREEIRGDLRYYHGKECTIVLPVATPIFKHDWKYAYEEKPVKPLSDLDREWKNVQKEKNELVRQLIACRDETFRTKALARLARLEVIELDLHQQAQRQHVMEPLMITPQAIPMMVAPVPVQVGGEQCRP